MLRAVRLAADGGALCAPTIRTASDFVCFVAFVVQTW